MEVVEVAKREPVFIDPALLTPLQRPGLPTQPILWPDTLPIIKQQDALLQQCNQRLIAIDQYQRDVAGKKNPNRPASE